MPYVDGLVFVEIARLMIFVILLLALNYGIYLFIMNS